MIMPETSPVVLRHLSQCQTSRSGTSRAFRGDSIRIVLCASAVKRKLFDRSADPPATMAKSVLPCLNAGLRGLPASRYDELKNSPNFEGGDLDRFVTLLSKVLDDKV